MATQMVCDRCGKKWSIRRIEDKRSCKTCRHWVKGLGKSKVCNRGYCKGALTRPGFGCGNWEPKEE